MNIITSENINKVSQGSLTQAIPLKPDLNTSTPKIDAVVLKETSNSSVDNHAKNIKPLSQKELLSNVNDMNQQLKASGSYLQFKVDKTTGLEVMQIFDEKTQKVIQQFPSKSFLKISAQIQDFLRGYPNQDGQGMDKALKGVLVNRMV